MNERLTVLQGDCREVLPTLPADSVHCCITSPPYWALRSYLPDGHPLKGKEIGLEPTLDEWVASMVAVFREVRRVLRPDGVLWLNLGDSYASQGGFRDYGSSDGGTGRAYNSGMRPAGDGLKPKDLCGQAWRVAFALQADGWFLRSCCIWDKTNPMPESVSDRPTTAHEYVFLLSRSERYFYDSDAVREKTGTEVSWEEYAVSPGRHAPSGNLREGVNAGFGSKRESFTHPAGRNLRTVWRIPTEAYAEAHFATFPRALAARCILAGTSEHGCCPACGAPWRRVVEKSAEDQAVAESMAGKHVSGSDPRKISEGHQAHKSPGWRGGGYVPQWATTGWQPTCDCPAADPVSCTVLDPFAGSGTVGQVAQSLGRRAILIELNPEYLPLVAKRTAQPGLFTS
jgi:DNA modification methylase